MTTTNLLRRIASTRSALLAIACVTLAPLHAQIAQRGSGTTNTTGPSSTSLTVNKPSDVAVGDLLIAVITRNSNSTDPNGFNTPSGWTSFEKKLINNPTGINKVTGAVFYKVATSSDLSASNYQFTFPNVGPGGTSTASGQSNSFGAAASIVAFSGVEPTAPIDANGAINVNGSGTSVTATGITTLSANTAVVMVGMVGGNSSQWSNWNTTSPGALTEIAEARRQGSSAAVAWALKPVAGATGNGTATQSVSGQPPASMLIALKPLPTALISANPTVIDQGGSTTLSWDSTGASSVEINNGIGSVATTGSTTVTPAATTTYTITGIFGGSPRSTSVTVVVMEPGPYRYYRFVPVTLRGGQNMVQLDEFQMVLDGDRVAATTTTNPGGSNQPADGEGSNKANDNIPAYTGVTGVDLGTNTKWLDGNKKPLVYDFGTTQNVTAYRWATGNDSDDRDPISWTVDGSHDGVNWKTLDTQTNYSVPTTRNAYLADFALPPFAGPAVNTFAVADPVIVIGSSTTLTWNVSNADSISIDNGIGTVSATGTATLSPQATTSYTLTAIGEGITRNRTVTLTVVNGGLLGKTYDTLAGTGNLDPITGLTGATPSGTFVETGAISYPNGTLTALPGITNASDFSVLWTGWFDVSIGGTGDYTFGVGSDDDSVIYLDLNNDGDFADAGEKVVSTGCCGGATSGTTGTVNLAMDSVRIAIGFTEGGGEDIMYAKYKKGSGLAFTSLDPISGTNEAFQPNQPTSGKPLITSFTAALSTVEPGDSTELSWVVTGADTVEISNGIGTVAASGSVSVTPANTTTYTLTATNAVGSRVRSVIVTVGYFPIDYDFDDNTFQGWTPVYLGTVTNPWLTDGGHGSPHNNTSNAVRSNYHDSAHPTMILRSPSFKLNGTGEMYAHVGGGSHNNSLANTDVSALQTNSTEPGFQGIALRNATTGRYVLSAQKSSDGNEYQKLTFSAAQLSGLDQTAVYTLDLVDTAHGGWGWVAMDTVRIPGALYAPPTPVITTNGTTAPLTTTYGTASSTTSFTVSAVNLTTGITATAPVGYEVSASEGSGFGGSITIGAAGTVSDTTVYVRIAAAASAGAPAGDVTLASTGAASKTVAVSGTVAAKAVTVTADAKSKTYGDADPALTFNASGLVGSDALSGALSRASGENAGTYAIGQGTLANANYSISFTGADLTISAKALTITADAKSKTYGDADPALTYSTSGLVAGDNLAGSLSRANGDDVGVYAISQGTLDAGSNYTVSFTGADLTITAKPLTFTGVTAADKVYDGTPSAVIDYSAVALSGVVAGDDVSLDTELMIGAFADKNVGSGKSVLLSGYSISGADSGNYNFTAQAGVTASITPASLDVTGVTVADKVYDGTTDAVADNGAVSLSGVISGDTVTLVSDSATASFADMNVGSGKAVLLGGYSISGADSGNYGLNQPAGVTADITAAPLTITADAKSKTYGDADPELTYTSSGLVGGDSISGSLTRASGEDAGTYAITQGTLDAGSNYSTTYTGADLTISAKSLASSDITLTRNEDDSYSASAVGVDGFTYSYQGRDGTSYGPSATAPSAPGSYTVTATADDPNYTGSKSEDYVVYESGDLTFSGLQPSYDGSGKSPVVSLNGTVNNDVTVGYRAIDRTAAPAVYSNLPASLDQSYPSHAYQAQQTSAFGNLVELGGTNRVGDHVEVVMVTWASAAMFPALAAEDPTGWRHPLTVSIGGLVDDGAGGSNISFTEESTVQIHIPWRPATVSEGGDYPYNGYAFKAVIPLSGKVALPEQCVVLVGFNTGTYGFEPLGYEGPFDYLNIAIDPNPETIGSDLDPDAVFVERDTNPPTAPVLGYESGWEAFGSPLITIAARESALTDPVFSSTPPVNAGDYHVYVTHPGGDEAYATLTILPAALAVGDITLTDNGDGSYSASADGVSGFAIVYEGRNGTSYGPSATPPTEPGDYKVTATSTDPNYSGSKSTDYSIAGPPPSDHPAYKITSISMVGSVCTMTWESQPDAVYTVQATANLADASSWQPIHSGIASGGSSTTVSVDLSTTSHNGAPKLFMRVVTGTPD